MPKLVFSKTNLRPSVEPKEFLWESPVNADDRQGCGHSGWEVVALRMVVVLWIRVELSLALQEEALISRIEFNNVLEEFYSKHAEKVAAENRFEEHEYMALAMMRMTQAPGASFVSGARRVSPTVEKA